MDEQPVKQNVYLLQPQFAVNFRGKRQYWLPYSVGCLWAYAKETESWVEEHFNCELLFKRLGVEQTMEDIKNPVAVGFSCYVWNEQFCLTIAEQVHEKYPDCKIFFGGPNVNLQMLEDYPFIDTIIDGEGEKTFVKILKDLKDGVEPPPHYFAERITDLSQLVSPYTSGVFDKIIADNPDAYWQVTFETNRGCPFSCTFCDWGGLTYSKVKQFEMDRIREEIKYIKKIPVAYMLCADANFGIFKDRDVEVAKLLYSELHDHPVLDSVNLQYYKNSNKHVIECAAALGRLNKGLTVSVQSMSDNTLKAIKRDNMRINKIGDLLAEADKKQIFTYTEMILGLPEETLDSWKDGMTDLLEEGQHHCIDVWLAQLLKNSELNRPDVREKYGIESTRVKDYYLAYNDDDSVEEYIDIITATNTMTTEELVAAYMYSWVIIRFHIYGYTKVLARVARAHGVSYREFYDRLLLNILDDEEIAEHYYEIAESITVYLKGNKDNLRNGMHLSYQATGSKKTTQTTSAYSADKNEVLKGLKESGRYNIKSEKGILKDEKDPKDEAKVTQAHTWIYMRSQDFLHERRDRLIEIGAETFKELLPYTQYEDVIGLQDDYIISESRNYPYYKSYTVDLDTFKPVNDSIQYLITGEEQVKRNRQFAERRTGSHIKSYIEKVAKNG